MALPTFLAMLVSVSLVSASLDVDGVENLNERYVFYVVPLPFVGSRSGCEEGLPRRRRGRWWSCSRLLHPRRRLVPFARLEHNASFQSPGLLPWFKLAAWVGRASGVCRWGRRRRRGPLADAVHPVEREGWVATLVWMSLLSVVAVGRRRHPAKYYANAYADARP